MPVGCEGDRADGVSPFFERDDWPFGAVKTRKILITSRSLVNHKSISVRFLACFACEPFRLSVHLNEKPLDV